MGNLQEKSMGNLLVLPKLFDIPEDVNDCMELIDIGCKALEKTTVLTKWHIGRIITHLILSDVKGVYNILEAKTGYKRRFLSHTARFYKAFEDIEIINRLCGKGVQWYILRELPTLDVDKRKEIIDKIITEDLSKDEIIVLAENAYSSEEIKDETEPNVYEDSPEEEEEAYIETHIAETATEGTNEDALELKRDSSKRKIDTYEGDDSLDAEKWFFQYNQKLVKLESEFADELLQVADYIILKDSVNDAKWEIINKIIDKIVINTTKFTSTLDVFKAQCSSNLESYTK